MKIFLCLVCKCRRHFLCTVYCARNWCQKNSCPDCFLFLYETNIFSSQTKIFSRLYGTSESMPLGMCVMACINKNSFVQTKIFIVYKRARTKKKTARIIFI